MTTLTYRRINNRGKLVEFTYSECDKDLVDKYTWYISQGYVTTNVKIDDKPRTKQLHRLIMGEPEGKQIDHIDGNPLDNTRVNLRECDMCDNMKNQGRYKNNTSSYSGVSWHKHRKKWHATISYTKKRIHLGYYMSLDDAINARKKAEKKYYGEFTRQNK